MTLKTALITLAAGWALLSPATLTAQTDNTPKFHATLRTRAELSTLTGEYRFQVRNARAVLSGNAGSSVSYFINTDLCDAGKMKILDAWAKLKIAKGLYVQGGQFRMCFGVDPFVAPHQYYFSNRSFIGKQMCNYRRVGVKLDYNIPTLPLTLEAGIFNPTSIADHNGWNKRLDAAGRLLFTPGPWIFSTGVMTLSPHGRRANLTGLCIGYNPGSFIIEAEYMLKHYTRSPLRDAHAYQIFASKTFPVKWGMFNTFAIHGRFDGLTDHSNSELDDNNQQYISDPARNRITAGVTLGYFKTKNLFADLRLDYEKYFYHSSTHVTATMGDKAVVELILRF